MKKLTYVFVSLLFVVSLTSCEKKHGMYADDEILAEDAKKSAQLLSIENIPSIPVAGVTPYIIPGENRGGNRTCEEVAEAFDAEFALCGDKIDYDEGAGEFDGEFPDGLNVTVDGIYVSFSIDGCLEINGGSYKVGAVIVKGSNAANVYYYADGTYGDENLAAPGERPMVSNLTFCFVPCEDTEEKIVALKFWSKDPSGSSWIGLSCGDLLFSTGRCSEFGEFPLGVNDYEIGSSFCVYSPKYGDEIGLVEISESGITVTLIADWELTSTFLFVGTQEELQSNPRDDGCPDHESWMVDWTDANSIFFPYP